MAGICKSDALVAGSRRAAPCSNSGAMKKAPVPVQRGPMGKIWRHQPCSSCMTVWGCWLAWASMAVAACEMICVRASSALALA